MSGGGGALVHRESEPAAIRHPRSLLVGGLGTTVLLAALLVDWGEAAPGRLLGRALGALMLVTLVSGLFFGYLAHFRRDALRSRARVSLVCLLTAVVAISAALMSRTAGWPPYLVPVSAATVVLAVVFDRRFALEVSWLLLLIVALILLRADGGGTGGRDLVRTMSVLAAGMLTAVLITGRIRTRGRIIEIGALIGVSHVVAVAAFMLIWPDSRPGPEWGILGHLGWGLAHGILVGFVVSGSLPLVEYVFGISTDISLLELSNIAQQTVLRRLLVAAPGTYNHSFIVGMLAEEAAEAIGANPLLARVGGYYHDIGKMMKPEYFGENEVVPGLHHRPLSPTMSVLIIRSHVKDGAELARHHDLPPPIIDIIEQHHGTTLVEYFYRKAQERAAKGTRVEESPFRYEGPNPQTREAGIVMIADSVEAATRSLSDPTPARVESTIRKIARAKLEDGQLDECGLTLAEVRRVEDAFIRVLAGIFHRRPRYPEIVRSAAAQREDDSPALDQPRGA